MQFNVYSITLLLFGLAAVFMSFFILRRSGEAVRQFTYISFGISIWSIAYAFELSSFSYENMLFWLRLEYIGVAFLPAMWIQFIIKFIGKKQWLSSSKEILLYLIPTITFLLVWTNNYHHLYYTDIKIDNSGPFPLLDLDEGPWYIIHAIFFYVLLILGLVLLLNKFIRADKVYRKQNYVIVLAALIPWIVNITYLFDIRPFKHIDLTPYAFSITCLVTSFGLIQLRLFDIIPVARDKIVEELQDGIMVLDYMDRIVDMNSQLKKIILTELNKKVSIGDLYSDYFIGHFSLIEKITNRVQTYYEFNINERCYEITINPLFEKNTIYSGVILIFRDITERNKSDIILKTQSEELQNLNQLKDKMFSIVAHDLRGPIVNLKEIMSLFDQKIISEEELKSHLPLINADVKATASLLENLLYWSRTQLKGERIHPSNINLHLLSIVQVNLLSSQIQEKSLSIINNIPEQANVYADKNMVELVMRNLISNAIKYCHPNNQITISANLKGEFYITEIADTGVGIDKENISKLFGMNNFSTVGTHSEKGTGLGLLLCKEFVEKNGGKIWVRSELGKGSAFSFSLPLH